MSFTELIASKSQGLHGRVRVPGDKSISHRALILGSLATGTTRISGLLEAEDVLATGEALRALGAGVERDEGGWRVSGRGIGGLNQAPGELDFGNSGTGARLMMGVVAGNDVTAVFTGDESLCRRPMARVLTPLRQMGLGVDGDGDTLPLALTGSTDLVPIVYELPVPSAQVKSAVLLAGLHAPGETTVIEDAPTRDHTERMLAFFGADVRTSSDGGRKSITVTGDSALSGSDVTVPGDPSSAAFLIAAALVTEGSDVTIEGVLINPTRTGFYQTLREMGAHLAFENEREEGGEPVADIRVSSSRLSGVEVPAARAPTMIDEYPVLAVTAAFADGETIMQGLGELRVKESDRLASTLAGLTACGVQASAGEDSLRVTGASAIAGGATIATHMDHRIAMAFLIMGLGSDKPVAIDNAPIIATSFPEFAGLMGDVGARVQSGG